MDIRLVFLFAVVYSVCGVSSAGETRPSARLEIKCGEAEMKITATPQFFQEKRVPFEARHLRLGANSTRGGACGARRHASDGVTVMVISAGLRDCGTRSSARGEWLVFSNQLLLFPAVAPTSSGSGIVRGATAVIPVECHYRRKQTVKAEPLTPTWLPMTSTVSVLGLLHFSLRTMTEDCASPRGSSVYQQGEPVFLEASVEAPLHPPLSVYVDHCVASLKPDPLSLPSYKFITKHGCLVDSLLPGSPSKFLQRRQENRLCFSFQAFHFGQESGKQMFISCHLRATLSQNSHSSLYKACFFHQPTFSWRPTEGDTALCECCNSDCFTGENSGNTTQPEAKHNADTTVGPLHTVPLSHWTGHLSINP